MYDRIYPPQPTKSGLDALRHYVNANYAIDRALFICSLDEGEDITVQYLDGKLQTDSALIASIKGIPKKLYKEKSFDAVFRISITNADFAAINDELIANSLKPFDSKKALVSARLKMLGKSEGKESKLYAHLKSTNISSDAWNQYVSWIGYGFLLPSHIELIYGADEDECYELIKESLEMLLKAKRRGKNVVDAVSVRPYKADVEQLRINL